MRQRARSACLALVLLLPPVNAGAQTLRGRLLDWDNGAPVATAFVTLRDGGGSVLAALLSDSAGAFTLRAPRAGRYTLHIERLGYRTYVSDTLQLQPGDALVRDFRIPVTAVRLAPIRISAATRCRGRRELAGEAAAIWEEVRKALTVAQWTNASGGIRYDVVEYERRLHPRTLEVLRERLTPGVIIRDGSPYVSSLPARELVEGGFVRDDGGYWVYDGPDADVLLSEEFLDAHCFRATQDRRRPGIIGLAFEPAAGTKPAIRGTLWIDRASFELRYVEFSYVRLPWRVSTPAAGGRVDFRRLPGGGWIVEGWWLRAPELTRPIGQTRIQLSGYTETGRRVTTMTAAGRTGS